MKKKVVDLKDIDFNVAKEEAKLDYTFAPLLLNNRQLW